MRHILRLRSEWAALGERAGEAIADSGRAEPYAPEEWELEDAAYDAGFQLLTRSLDAHRREAATDEGLWEAFRQERAKRLALWERRYAGQQWGEWERIADRIIEIRSWQVAKGGEVYARFVGMIAESFMDGLRVASERDYARPEPQPTSRTAKRASERRSASGGSGKTIAEMLEGYARRRRIDGVREAERKAISRRTSEALAAAKARGVRLGGARGNASDLLKGPAASAAKRSQIAQDRAVKVMRQIRALEEGNLSLRHIAASLNERGITAPRGGLWSAAQVRVVIQRVEDDG